MKSPSAIPVDTETPAVLEAEAGDHQSLAGDHLSHENIEALAYHLWEARGCPVGSPEQDWHQAEQMLSSRAEE